MKLKFLFPVALLIALPATISNAAPQTLPLSASKSITNEPHISLSIGSATLAQIVQELGKRYSINILTDSFAGEQNSIPFLWKDVPLSQVLQELANSFQRDIYIMDGIYVMRHRYWATLAAQETGTDRLYQWKEAGTVSVARSESEPEVKKELPLPASKINLIAQQASSIDIAAEITAKATVATRVGPEVSRRRVTAYLTDVSPSVALQGLAFVLDAGPEVVLRPSPAQLALQADAQDHRLPWDKASDKIRPQLEKLLTEDQRKAITNGEKVGLSVDSLPKDLQGQVTDYMQSKAGWIIKDGRQLDMKRSGQFQIMFMPRQYAPGGGFGVMAYDSNGIQVFF
jgi:hypothetical protein